MRVKPAGIRDGASTPSRTDAPCRRAAARSWGWPPAGETAPKRPWTASRASPVTAPRGARDGAGGGPPIVTAGTWRRGPRRRGAAAPAPSGGRPVGHGGPLPLAALLGDRTVAACIERLG